MKNLKSGWYLAMLNSLPHCLGLLLGCCYAVSLCLFTLFAKVFYVVSRVFLLFI